MYHKSQRQFAPLKNFSFKRDSSEKAFSLNLPDYNFHKSISLVKLQLSVDRLNLGMQRKNDSSNFENKNSLFSLTVKDLNSVLVQAQRVSDNYLKRDDTKKKRNQVDAEYEQRVFLTQSKPKAEQSKHKYVKIWKCGLLKPDENQKRLQEDFNTFYENYRMMYKTKIRDIDKKFRAPPRPFTLLKMTKRLMLPEIATTKPIPKIQI